jgi:hypothetical protein
MTSAKYAIAGRAILDLVEKWDDALAESGGESSTTSLMLNDFSNLARAMLTWE